MIEGGFRQPGLTRSGSRRNFTGTILIATLQANHGGYMKRHLSALLIAVVLILVQTAAAAKNGSVIFDPVFGRGFVPLSVVQNIFAINSGLFKKVTEQVTFRYYETRN